MKKTLAVTAVAFFCLNASQAWGDDMIGFLGDSAFSGAAVLMVPAMGGSDTPVYQDRWPAEDFTPPIMRHRGSWDPQWLPDGKHVVIKLNLYDADGGFIRGRVLYLASAPIPRRHQLGRR